MPSPFSNGSGFSPNPPGTSPQNVFPLAVKTHQGFHLKNIHSYMCWQLSWTTRLFFSGNLRRYLYRYSPSEDYILVSLSHHCRLYLHSLHRLYSPGFCPENPRPSAVFSCPSSSRPDPIHKNTHCPFLSALSACYGTTGSFYPSTGLKSYPGIYPHIP